MSLQFSEVSRIIRDHQQSIRTSGGGVRHAECGQEGREGCIVCGRPQYCIIAFKQASKLSVRCMLMLHLHYALSRRYLFSILTRPGFYSPGSYLPLSMSFVVYVTGIINNVSVAINQARRFKVFGGNERPLNPEPNAIAAYVR